MLYLKQSTAVTVKIGPFVDSTDGVTAETGLTISQADVRLSKNGADIAQKTEATSCTHDEIGVYNCPLDATDTGTLGRLQLWVAEAGALPVFHEFMVCPANVWDSLFGADALQVHANEITAGLITAAAIADAAIDAAAFAAGAITATVIATGAVDADAIAADAIAEIADGIWDEARAGHVAAGSFGEGVASVQGAVTGAVASVTGAVGSVTGAVASVTAGVTLADGAITAAKIAADAIGASELAADAVAEIADAVWDEVASGHTTVATFGQRLQAIRTGTAQAGAANSITLDASASATDDFYKNALILITAGTGASQVRTCSAYTGATKVAAVTPNWATNPANDSVFAILPMGAIAGASAPTATEVADAVWDELSTGHTDAGKAGEQLWTDVDAIKAKTDNLPADPADDSDIDTQLAAIAGYIDTEVASILAAVDTEVAAILADTNELQTDWVNGGRLDLLVDAILADTGTDGVALPDGVITAAKIAADAIGASELAADAVAEIADQVWDELIAGHLGAGSTGAALSSATAPTAAAVADAVWDEAIAGHDTEDSVGNVLNDLTEESGGVYRFTSAALATAPTGGAGSGAITFTYTVTSSVTGLPIADADVWVTTDQAGANIVASGTTNASGQVVFYLDAGTYYVWRQKSGWNFTNPDTETVA